MSDQPLHILMVCLGNICRSPTAEAVFKARVHERGLQDRITVDSAGTSDWHMGEPPDPRAVQFAAGRHYDLKSIRARQVEPGDFDRFDYILAMDRANLDVLRSRCPPEHRHKLSLFLAHADNDFEEVPDPYHSGDDGFELVLDLVEEASDNLLKRIIEEHRLPQ